MLDRTEKRKLKSISKELVLRKGMIAEQSEAIKKLQAERQSFAADVQPLNADQRLRQSDIAMEVAVRKDLIALHRQKMIALSEARKILTERGVDESSFAEMVGNDR